MDKAMKSINRLLLLTTLSIFFNACEQSELTPEIQLEEGFRKGDITQNEHLSDLIGHIPNLSNGRTQGSLSFHTEIGILQLDQIIEKIPKNGEKPNYTIRLIPHENTSGAREYLVLVPVNDYFEGYIIQFHLEGGVQIHISQTSAERSAFWT